MIPLSGPTLAKNTLKFFRICRRHTAEIWLRTFYDRNIAATGQSTVKAAIVISHYK